MTKEELLQLSREQLKALETESTIQEEPLNVSVGRTGTYDIFPHARYCECNECVPHQSR